MYKVYRIECKSSGFGPWTGASKGIYSMTNVHNSDEYPATYQDYDEDVFELFRSRPDTIRHACTSIEWLRYWFFSTPELSEFIKKYYNILEVTVSKHIISNSKCQTVYYIEDVISSKQIDIE